MANLSKVGQEFEQDMEDQFRSMFYAVTCGTCGEVVTHSLLSEDFARPGLTKVHHDLIVAHNIGHLTPISSVHGDHQYLLTDLTIRAIAKAPGLK